MGPPHSITVHVSHLRAVREGKKRETGHGSMGMKTTNGNEDDQLKTEIINGNESYEREGNLPNEMECPRTYTRSSKR